MTVISFAGTRLLDRVGASPAGPASTLGPPATRNRQSAVADAGARVTRGLHDGSSAVYGDPRAAAAPQAGLGRLWASPGNSDDTVSALMARNRGLSIYNLGNQWRGLGGALLTRLGRTGEDYTQTLVDDRTSATDSELAGLTPETQAQRAAEVLAAQTAALAGVADNVPTAEFKIRTRSGQSVELRIAANPGINGIVGVKVELKSSGALSADERAAVQALANGLDRALEGLGRDDAVGIDLSGLLSYDRKAIAGLDLTVEIHQTGRALGSFALHLGDDKPSVMLKGVEGEMHLSIDAKSPLGDVSAPQRDAAVRRMLDRIDSAGQRGQANAALVEQMKSAFTQLQAAVAAGDEAPNAAGGSPGDAQAAPLLSGLADFEAGFGGETWRSNADGTTGQAGQVSYRLSQQTQATPNGAAGQSTTQAVSEQLSADFREAPGGRMLDVTTGNFTATRVRDSSEVSTLIESAADGVTRALRKTQEQQLKTVTGFESGREVRRQEWPVQRRWLQRVG